MEYGGFWRRVGAFVVDVVVMLPVVATVVYWGIPRSQFFLMYWLVPSIAINAAYNIYLVKRWGGTPGLLAFKLRIRMLDNTPVTLKAAAIRYSVLLVLSTLAAIGGIIGSLRIDEAAYFSMGAPQITAELARLQPIWSRVAGLAAQLWLYGEFICLLFNKKRRGQQDFMAGTVVVKAHSLAAREAALTNPAP